MKTDFKTSFHDVKLITVVIGLCLPIQVQAEETAPQKKDDTDIIGYRPGDAFFYGRLTRAAIEQSGSEKKLRLTYDEFPNRVPGFRNYFGFGELESKQECPQLIANLERVYERERRFRPLVESVQQGEKPLRTEINGFHVFVVDNSFNYREMIFGLRYNKDWHRPPLEAQDNAKNWPFGNSGFMPQPYHSFIAGTTAVLEDWSRSSKVPPLKTTIPAGVAWADLMAETIKTPVIVDLDQAEVYVLPRDDLQDYFPIGPKFIAYRVRAEEVTSIKVDGDLGDDDGWFEKKLDD